MSELSIGKRIEAFSELADRLRALHLSEAEAAADPVRRVIADQVNNNPGSLSSRSIARFRNGSTFCLRKI